MTILVVEDEELINRMLQMALRPLGIDVVFAQSVPEAFGVLEQEIPELIVMDIYLPGSKGWELLDAIREDPLTREIPVIVLTAHTETMYQREATVLGVREFLTKPVLPDVLREAVLRALNR